MKTLNSDSIAAEKRRRILDAAIKVFAAKGYHGCRVSDIATEAGIAYGLVYHYFKSKEEILNSIFIEKWSVFLQVMRHIDERQIELDKKLYEIAHFLLAGYQQMPELMEVLILEIARSQKVLEQKNLEILNEAFVIVENMFAKEKKDKKLRRGVDPRLAAYTFFGSIESVLTGYVLRTLPLPDEKSRQKTEKFIIDSFLKGIIRSE